MQTVKEGDDMNKEGMTMVGKIDSGLTNLKAKVIKNTGANRSFTRRKAIPKRSSGFSYKK